ncbi:hypothetical protein Dip518_000066 [Parelusimicrobium proximum]|uniref:hypothetical protein n=1 Tax=Parelusimicrobium proximum TaxID=3228953 RepID=UPI003D16B7AA
MKRIVTAVLMFSLLTACSTVKKKYDTMSRRLTKPGVNIAYNQADADNKSKGIVVFNYEDDLKDYFGSSATYKIRMIWGSKDTKDFYFNPKSNDVSYAMLPPGEYDLKRFSIHSRSNITRGKMDLGDRYTASFTVVPGEITYLGKIVFESVAGSVTPGFLPNRTQTEMYIRTALSDSPDTAEEILKKLKEKTGWEVKTNLMTWRPPNSRE